MSAIGIGIGIIFNNKHNFSENHYAQGLIWDSSTDTYIRTDTLSSFPNNISPGNENLPIHQLMKRCLLLDNGTVNYYLDTDDSTKKANGTASDLSGADGQVMVEIPKFYYKHVFSGNTKEWAISLFPIPGFQIHPAFIKDGAIVDYRYAGAYEGSMFDASIDAMCIKDAIHTNIYTKGDKLCSVSGQWPKTYETRDEFRAMAVERAPGFRQLDYYLHSAIQLLYLIEYANFNSQTTIGAGRTNLSGGTWTADSYIGGTGFSNNIGNGTHSIANGGTAGYLTDYMVYRGIENIFGNVWKFIDGLNVDGSWQGNYAAMPMYATNDAALFSGYGDFGDESLLCNASYIGKDAGYISNIENNTGFIPSEANGSSTTKVCDYYWQYNQEARNYWRVPLSGAHATNGGQAGVFALVVHNAWSFASAYFGGRLCF